MQTRTIAIASATALALTLSAGAARAGSTIYNCNPSPDSCGGGYACTPSTSWTYVPGYIANAARGDLSFRTPQPATYQNDPMSMVLEYMGQNRSHVGMVTSSTTVRNNTRNSTLQVVASKLVNRYGGGSCSPGDAYFDPTWLKQGTAGDGLQTNDGYGFVTLPGYTNTIVQAFRDGRQANALASAARLEQLQLGYLLYAYTRQDVGTTLSGNMCSGSILEASKAAPNAFQDQWYSPDTRSFFIWNSQVAYPETVPPGHFAAASCPNGVCSGLYPALVEYIFEFINSRGMGCLTSTGTQAVSYGIARQLINCFAFNDCGADAGGNVEPQDQLAFSSGWNATAGNFHYVDWGYTASPDDLVNQVNAGTTNYQPGEIAAATGGNFYDPTTTYSCTPNQVCGDAACTGTETCSTCPGDCGRCAPPPPPPPPPPNCPHCVTP